MADAQEYPTVIGPDAKFKGQLQFEKGLRLMGQFDGEITSGGDLLVGEGASLKGDVKARSVRIEGAVNGNLEAGSKVQLSASARLEGDLNTQRLEVSEGAVLIGHVTVGVNGAGKAMEKSKDAIGMPGKSKAADAVGTAKK